jgi:hypothetical protein
LRDQVHQGGQGSNWWRCAARVATRQHLTACSSAILRGTRLAQSAHLLRGIEPIYSSKVVLGGGVLCRDAQGSQGPAKPTQPQRGGCRSNYDDWEYSLQHSLQEHSRQACRFTPSSYQYNVPMDACIPQLFDASKCVTQAFAPCTQVRAPMSAAPPGPCLLGF